MDRHRSLPRVLSLSVLGTSTFTHGGFDAAIFQEVIAE